MRLPLALVALAACKMADGKPQHASHVDCALVAASLTSLEMGNYADPEKRAPRETELAAKCRDADLTDGQAKCLLDATATTLAYCEKPIAVAHRDVPRDVVADGLPLACRDYLSALQRLAACPKLPAQSRQAIFDASKQASQAWSQVIQNQQAFASLQSACASAVSAIGQSMQSIGCP